MSDVLLVGGPADGKRVVLHPESNALWLTIDVETPVGPVTCVYRDLRYGRTDDTRRMHYIADENAGAIIEVTRPHRWWQFWRWGGLVTA